MGAVHTYTDMAAINEPVDHTDMVAPAAKKRRVVLKVDFPVPSLKKIIDKTHDFCIDVVVKLSVDAVLSRWTSAGLEPGTTFRDATDINRWDLRTGNKRNVVPCIVLNNPFDRDYTTITFEARDKFGPESTRDVYTAKKIPIIMRALAVIADDPAISDVALFEAAAYIKYMLTGDAIASPELDAMAKRLPAPEPKVFRVEWCDVLRLAKILTAKPAAVAAVASA